jgi:TfoX/Sxy family transcriptional regulator of competence genes/ligand-binding SRPBCC domain-containing protein
MTVLETSIRIQATPERVWRVLAALEALDRYDPGVTKSEVISATREGAGAERKCELAPGGWFKERVAEWQPTTSLSFELFECTLPLRRLQHRYELVADGDATVVRQRMEYALKLGLIGKVLDALVVRRRWKAGIDGFFAGLKEFVETGRARRNVPYDEALARRVRDALDGRPDVTERKMFGGLTFLVGGNMFCGVVDRDLMVRVGRERHADTLGEPHVRPMDFTGRPLTGYIYVGAAGLRTVAAVATWVRRGLEQVEMLLAVSPRALPRRRAARTRRRASAAASASSRAGRAASRSGRA